MKNQYLFYKVLNEDGSPCWGGDRNWPLPSNDNSENWIEVVGELEEASNGLHLCSLSILPFWIGPAIFVVATEGEILNDDLSKPVARKARILFRVACWNREALKIFANKCYSHVYEQVKKNKRNEIEKHVKPLLEANQFHQIPRQIAEYSDSYEIESQWQIEFVYQYIKDDKNLKNHVLNTDSLKPAGWFTVGRSAL